MNIVFFVIFLLTDFFMVLICKFAYGKRDRYERGMIMGVHIPPEEKNHPEVRKICEKNMEQWKIFHRINFPVSILICFLSFWDTMFFLLIWMGWVVEYIAGLYYLILTPHRKMYRLKVKNQWINEETKHMVYIDTKVSASSGEMSYGWKWHIPAVLLLLATGILLFKHSADFSGEGMEWTLYAAAGIMTLTFTGLHYWIVNKRNVVYSKNTEINYSVNRMGKRAWSAGFLMADGINIASWCYLLVRIVVWGWIRGIDLGIYLFLQLVMTAAFLLPVVYIHGKKQEILENDSVPVYIDDDEYWKNGWYNNPGDFRLMVQDRMNSMNYTFNMARPAAKVITGALWSILAGVLVWFTIVMVQLINAEVVLSVNGSEIRVEAAGYECGFNRADIKEVELLQEMPEENMSRTNGASTEKYLIGYFKGRESGKCMLFLYRGESPVLKVDLGEKMLFVNSMREGEAEEWFQELKDG